MENRYPFTEEQIERIKEICGTINAAFLDMSDSIQRAIQPFFSSEDLLRISKKAKRREKYLRRYERIGKQRRK